MISKKSESRIIQSLDQYLNKQILQRQIFEQILFTFYFNGLLTQFIIIILLGSSILLYCYFNWNFHEFSIPIIAIAEIKMGMNCIKSEKVFINIIQYQIYLMSFSSPSLEAILQRNQKKMRQTKIIIKDSKEDAPVLSAIVDYGGQSSVDEILTLDQLDKSQKHFNNFEKILIQSTQSNDQAKSRKYLSFIEYKSDPSKANQSKNKKSKKLLNSIVVQMPQQLKEMKNQILSLPSVNQSRFIPPQNTTSRSRILDDLKKIESRRYATESSEPLNQFQRRKKRYLLNLKDILSEFESPEIQCNSYIQARHDECKRLLQHEQTLSNQYKRFQKLGSPPKKIINLKNMLLKFQTTIDHSLDSELARQLSNMDNKRYDIVLKHEQEVKKQNMVKFQQKRKQQKIEECKNPFVEFHLSEKLGFKLNSKGKEIYTNKMKTVK